MAASVQIFGSESLNDYQVVFYEDLATIPNPIIGETAKVEKPSGGLFGVGSNEPGTYLFNGTDWEFLSRTLKQEILTKASAAQGALADTAIQPNDNISLLNNDEGFISTETDPIFQASEASNFVTGDKSNLDNQSGVNTGDETTSSIQNKRPLKTVNGNSLEGLGNIIISGGSGAEELDDLADVNTQSVFPQTGWVLKFNGSLYVPSMREIVNSSGLVTNDFNTLPSTKISQAFNFQRSGTYSLTVHFSWSHNSTGNDFRANLIFDGVGVGALNNTEIFEVEPKDSAGNDADGRGTNQKLQFCQKYFVNVTTTGNKLVELTFQPQTDFVISSMWDATIIVEEEFGINFQ